MGGGAGSPLGRTQVDAHGLTGGSIRIYYDAVERALDLLSFDERRSVLGYSHVAYDDLGRALGRILAHEIGHVLLAAPNHQRHGLMRAQFAAGDLLVRDRGQYSLSEREIAQLHNRFRQALPSVLEEDATGCCQGTNPHVAPALKGCD
jgi:hypothetical protein